MAWGRIDDGFHDHPKVENLSLAAVGLWTVNFTWAHRHRRNAPIPGFIPTGRVARLAGKHADALVAELTAAMPGKKHGLWEPVDGGWLIHDFEQYLPKRRDPDEAAEAGRRGAEKRWHSDTDQHGNEVANSYPVSHETATSPVADHMAVDSSRASTRASPSRPVPEATDVASEPRKRGTRLSPDWTPTPTDVEWQRAQGIGDAIARRELPKFIDYWPAKPGKEGLKLDWSATWRNWLRTTQEREPKQPQRQQHPAGWEFGMDR